MVGAVTAAIPAVDVDARLVAPVRVVVPVTMAAAMVVGQIHKRSECRYSSSWCWAWLLAWSARCKLSGLAGSLRAARKVASAAKRRSNGTSASVRPMGRRRRTEPNQLSNTVTASEAAANCPLFISYSST